MSPTSSEEKNLGVAQIDETRAAKKAAATAARQAAFLADPGRIAQVEKNKAEHAVKAATIKAEKDKIRATQRAASLYLIENGFRMIYKDYIFPSLDTNEECDVGGLSIAYRIDDDITDADIEVVFSARSPEDQFSRPDARIVLARRCQIEEGEEGSEKELRYSRNIVTDLTAASNQLEDMILLRVLHLTLVEPDLFPKSLVAYTRSYFNRYGSFVC